MKTKSIKTILITAALLLSSSCHVAQTRYHYQKEFEILPGRQIKSDSITVIPGKNRDIDFVFAKYLTDELEKKSSFNVTPFDKVQKTMAKPRDLIVETEESKRIDISTLDGASWISDAAKKNISELSKKFKTKYIYVVWLSNLTQLKGGGNFVAFFVDGRFIELPQNEVIALTYEGYNKETGTFISKPMAENIDLLMKEAADKLSDEILNVSHLNK